MGKNNKYDRKPYLFNVIVFLKKIFNRKQNMENTGSKDNVSFLYSLVIFCTEPCKLLNQ